MQISRCSMSKLLLVLLGGAQWGSASPRGRMQQQCQRTKVAVLGAGTAGIRAAQVLSEQSVTDFVILEYNSDIGGRMNDTKFGAGDQSYTVELGANWVQGLENPSGAENPIWTLAKKYNLNNTYSDLESLATFDESGPNDFAGLLAEFDEAYTVVEQESGVILSNSLPDRDFREGMRLAGWDPTNDAQRQAIDWYYVDFEYARTPEEISQVWSVANYNATFYQWSEENNIVYDQRGFKTILLGEASTFLAPNDPRLRLNTIVKSISYGDYGVTVQNTDGSCVRAEYAICTFSVGVLDNDVVAFNPPLPAWKRDSISAFDMGTFTKIYIQFPTDQIFWNQSTQFFLYADPDTRGYFPLFQSLDTPGFLEGSGILLATVTTSESYRLERQSDEETKAEVLEVLRTMFGRDVVPEPIAFMYPRWSTEPWVYGSYSNWPTNVTLESHQNLRANVGRLYFAGEATSTPYFGFLHGAWTEGEEAGLRVARCVRTRGDCPDMQRYETLEGPEGVSRSENLNAEHGFTVDTRLFAPPPEEEEEGGNRPE